MNWLTAATNQQPLRSRQSGCLTAINVKRRWLLEVPGAIALRLIKEADTTGRLMS